MDKSIAKWDRLLGRRDRVWENKEGDGIFMVPQGAAVGIRGLLIANG